jgi:hypothetical protein
MGKVLRGYTWRSGLIEFGARIPVGAMPIGASRDQSRLREIVIANARHGYDGSLLVPGVPEAVDDASALKAVKYFRDLVMMRLDGVAGFPERVSA